MHFLLLSELQQYPKEHNYIQPGSHKPVATTSILSIFIVTVETVNI